MKLSDIEGRLQEMLRDSGQQPLSTDQVEKFGSYLKMLLHWNARINLTSIRDEEGIIALGGSRVRCTRFLTMARAADFPGFPVRSAWMDYEWCWLNPKGRRQPSCGRLCGTWGWEPRSFRAECRTWSLECSTR